LNFRFRPSRQFGSEFPMNRIDSSRSKQILVILPVRLGKPLAVLRQPDQLGAWSNH
jgi:hypothetical protein